MRTMKVLLVGSTGHLGRAIYDAWTSTPEYHNIVIYTLSRSGVKSRFHFVCDLRDPKLYVPLLMNLYFDVVIYAAADLDFINSSYEDQVALNVTAPTIINRLINPRLFVYMSTPTVIGDNPAKSVNAVPFPLNDYSRTKDLGETVFLNSPNAVIVRADFVSTRGGLLKNLVDGLVLSDVVYGFGNVVFTPVSTAFLSRWIFWLIDQDAMKLKKLYHVCLDRKISKFDLLAFINLFALQVVESKARIKKTNYVYDDVFGMEKPTDHSLVANDEQATMSVQDFLGDIKADIHEYLRTWDYYG